MTRDEVLELIREHLADELELDPARIQESTHFREDLSADSLDLYTLVQELEDQYGVKMSDEEAARIHTVREASTSSWPTTRRGPDRCASCTTCSSGCRTISPGRRSRIRPGRSGGRSPTSAWRSWATPCSASPSRRTCTHACEPDAYGAGRLTKIRAQAVSGRSCREVAERLGIPERLRNAAPESVAGPATEQLARTERVLASVIEAVIGAVYLEFGYLETADAVVEAFTPEIERSLVQPGGLQVGAAGAPGAARDDRDVRDRRRGGPAARADLRGRGDGRRRAAGPRLRALEEGRGAGRGRGGAGVAERRRMHASELDHPEGLQVLPGPHAADVLAGRVGDRRPERLRQVQHHRRRAVGDGRAVAGGRARRVDAGRDLRGRARRAGARPRPRSRSCSTTRPAGWTCRSARSRSRASSTARGRASTASTAPSAGSPTSSRSSRTPAWARRCTRSSRRGGWRRSSPPSRATGGC